MPSLFWVWIPPRSKSLTFASHVTEAPSTPIRIFLKTGIFSSVLVFRPHVNSIFGHQKGIFSQKVPRMEILENAGLWADH